MPQFSDSQLDDLRKTYDYLRRELLDQRCRDGYWIGELSSSALATATAISALCQYQKTSKSTIVSPTEIDSLVSKGLAWIIARQNSDGGWGDTDASHSNIATTMLVVAALRLSNCQKRYSDQLEGANRYVKNNGAVEGLRQRYGKDKTFAVPILANCAIAELVEWKEVSELPFEAAAVPQAMFRFLQLPVVSYAIPALVAI